MPNKTKEKFNSFRTLTCEHRFKWFGINIKIYIYIHLYVYASHAKIGDSYTDIEWKMSEITHQQTHTIFESVVSLNVFPLKEEIQTIARNENAITNDLSLYISFDQPNHRHSLDFNRITRHFQWIRSIASFILIESFTFIRYKNVYWLSIIEIARIFNEILGLNKSKTKCIWFVYLRSAPNPSEIATFKLNNTTN